MHGKLSFSKASKLRKWRWKGGILLDSGDAISAGNLDFRYKERVFWYMNWAGYAAGAVGNREFHPFHFLFKWKIREAHFPHLLANFSSPVIPSNVQPYLLLDIDGERVGLIGLSLPMLKGFWGAILKSEFSDPFEVAEKLVGELRERVDFVVMLTHLGISRDIALAKRVKGIDLILGGHSHIAFPSPVKVGSTYIMHSGHHARTVGLVEITKTGVKGWLEEI